MRWLSGGLIVAWEGDPSMSESDDLELEMLRRRKLLRLRRLLEKRKLKKGGYDKLEQTDPQKILDRFFVGRAWEVMKAARLQYPRVARQVERALVRLILEGRIRDKITGEDLYALFYRLGFRIRLETKIRILKKGRIMSLQEKIRGEM